MKPIIVIILAIIFCSCTSSGKLTDAKFPFALHFRGYLPNKYPLPIDPITGANIVGTYYLQADFTPTVPSNVGSYAVTASITDWAALERIQHKYNIIFYSIVFGVPLCLFLLSLVFGRKDEVITLPNEYTQKLLNMKNKLTNILATLLFMVIAFCSCTSSGKLTDAKFPYIHIISYPAKLSQLTVTYNGYPIINAGSYPVVASISNENYLVKKERPKFNILKYLPYVGIGLSILLGILFFKLKRDEVITLPDEFTQNY